MTGFPSVPLSIKVELLLNGAWTDVSTYILSRDTIAITGGRTNRGDKAQPAQAALTFDNRDGRFSPANTSGAYYPYIGRNTQIRISVTATSSTGNFYSGYRFWGEIPAWPPISDISGNDIYVQATASGPLRRIRTGGGKGSALTRYYAALTGSFAPIAYWPGEEDPDTTILGAGIEGGTDMAVTSGTPKWKADSSFNGSAPIAHVNGSTWDGLTGSFGSSGDDIFTTPGTYQWVASTSTVDAIVTGPSGGGASGNPFAAQGGCAGGGGERARESALAVTIGNSYTIVIPAGGAPGAGIGSSGTGSNPGSDGAGIASIAGDSVTVAAHPGKGGTNLAGGLPGTGSSNTAHHDGGTGATANSGDAGAGGGSTGGTSAAGNAGSAQSGNTAGAGGAAPAGGFAGGKGGDAPTGSPATGGGGGGGPYNAAGKFGRAGAAGAPARVELVYTPQSVPNNNVIRFIMIVPAHGGNNGKVILRALTGGTIARLDVLYVTGGKIQLKGYNNVASLLFTSSNLTIGDGQTVMVSAELAPSGASVAYKLSAITPGASGVIGTVSGTQAAASIGNVTEILVAPNGDITKTAIGHISVQYALIPLYLVSKALHGHHTEIGVDRLVRLLNEQALGSTIEFNEGADHWGFEAGTQSWAATNCALTSSTVTATTSITSYTLFTSWPPEGSHSLLITASGGGTIKATSPIGTSGQPVIPNDIVSANLEVYTPSAVSGTLTASLDFFNAAGTFLSSVGTATFTGAAGQQQTVNLTTGGGGAPATAAFFAISLVSSAVLGAGVLIYVDHVRVHTRMGPQTRKEYHKFLEEIEDLDQGIMKEAKELLGLKYRTRFRLINQTPAVTLDYSAQQLAEPPAPVIDDQKTKNDITVHRHKGSKVRLTLNSGGMSVQEPPAGAGRYRRHVKAAAERDEQLMALANHLLTLGTTPDERYPAISVSLHRSEVAALMSAIAGVEIGDYVKLTNLPFWYPSATAKQLVIGYTETLGNGNGMYTWDITWNCTPESPLEITSTLQRRW